MGSKQELTVQIDATLVEAAEEYARAHGTTLQVLISEFFNQLSIAQREEPPTPVLDRLAGILPPDASIDKHREALSKKYMDRE